MEDLLLERKDGIATVTLDRPQRMNALSGRLRSELQQTFEGFASDPDVGVVILTGAGEKAFSAGIDLKELSGQEAGGAGDDAVVGGSRLIEAIERCPQPVIGAINGFAITGGFELALACDVLIGSTNARFSDTHARVGIVPGWGLSQKLSRLVGISRAKEVSLTGNHLDARTACAWGLLNRVVAPEELLPTCEALARDMLSCDPVVLREYKRVIDAGFALAYGEGRRLEAEASRAHGTDVSADRVATVQQRGRSQTG